MKEEMRFKYKSYPSEGYEIKSRPQRHIRLSENTTERACYCFQGGHEMDRIYLFSFVISAGKKNIYGKALFKNFKKLPFSLKSSGVKKKTIIKFICQIHYLGEKVFSFTNFFLFSLFFFLFYNPDNNFETQ